MIECVIFDMDGTLIDSEPHWRTAEKKVFKSVGIDLTDKMLSSTIGMRCDEVVKHWHNIHPWDTKTLKQVEIELLAIVQELVEKDGKAMEGVYDILDFFMNKQIPLALASSSPLGIIQSVVDHLELSKYFKVTASAEFEEYGKPHPAVFIATANYMRVEPKNCLVFEDSVNGVLAAKAALMKCVAVPDHIPADDKRFGIADLIIPSLAQFTTKHLEELNG